MHHAPSVDFPVGRSLWVGALLVIAGGSGLAASLVWAAQGNTPGFWPVGAVLLALALFAWAALDWLRTPFGVLSWDGRQWRWTGAPQGVGRVRVCLDLQGLLLLQWRADSASTAWLWLEARCSPGRWSDLRRAVYSRAGSDALPGAEPPAARP